MSINPILAALGNQLPTPAARPQTPNNPLALLSEFAKFKKAFADKDPYAVLDQLRSSGAMSQKDYEMLKAEAESLISFLK